MDIHLPKVPHSWRELAKEIAIIVVGVLIALFFEALVDSWRWHRTVASAKAAMRKELLWDDGPQIYQRAALHPCITASLDQIRAALDSGASRAEVAGLVDRFSLPFFRSAKSGAFSMGHARSKAGPRRVRSRCVRSPTATTRSSSIFITTHENESRAFRFG